MVVSHDYGYKFCELTRYLNETKIFFFLKNVFSSVCVSAKYERNSYHNENLSWSSFIILETHFRVNLTVVNAQHYSRGRWCQNWKYVLNKKFTNVH